MQAWVRVPLFFLLAVVASCRATNPTMEADIESAADKPWFDLYGDTVACEVPQGGCTANTYDKDFVDLCVSKGFQAKTCGCTAGCSGKVVMKAKASLGAADAQNAADLCTKADHDMIDGAARAQGTAAKCFHDALCNGDPSACDGEQTNTAFQLRDLARGHCKDAAMGALCAGASKDTLACGNAEVAKLSSLYSKAFDAKEPVAFRRCVRQRLCNKMRTGGCSEAELKVVTAAETALQQGAGACSYWLALICSIDGK